MHRLTAPLLLVSLTLTACPDTGQSTTTSASASVGTSESSGSGTSGESSSTTMDDPTAGTTGDPTGDPTTGTTGDPTTGTTGDPTGDPTTGDPNDPQSCDLDTVEDKTYFTFSKKFPTGMKSKQTQASFYNSYANEVVLLTFDGEARRYDTDGTPLAPPFQVPAEALPALDGATYDAKLTRALLINQGCTLVEADPVTLAVHSVKKLGFGLDVCAGIAIGADNNLYIASDMTQEIVVLDRNATKEIRRIKNLDTLGIDGPDGIALIAGSENFIVIGTNGVVGAVGVMDPLGNFVVPGADIGPGSAFDGAPPNLPDAVLTLCHRSVAWLCDAFDGTCSEYVPTNGVIDACGCIEKPPTCSVDQSPDIVAYTEVGSFATGLPNPELQASFYNFNAQEVVIMTYSGKARRFDINGTPLSDVFDVPPEAAVMLDGAAYDPNLDRGLLITQDCALVEVDPKSFAVLDTHTIGFGASTCSGVAVGLDGNLYIASDSTDEIIVVSRDTSMEIRRFDTLAAGIDGPDGISLISGSANFLVIGTENDPMPSSVAIFDPMGGVVVPEAEIGSGMPPLADGPAVSVDASLTLCGNSHAWVCEAYADLCHDFAPSGGDINTCACVLPG